MNYFEQAVRQQLRFNFNGSVSIEDLYKVKINFGAKSFNDFHAALIVYEATLIKEVEGFVKSTRLEPVQVEKTQKDTKLRLAIISQLLDEIAASKELSKQAAAVKELSEKAKLILRKRQDEDLQKLSSEELAKYIV